MESRKTRTRKARKRLTRRQSRLRHLKELLAFGGGCYFLFHSLTEAASAIGAIGDAKDAGERLRGEAKRIAEYRQNLKYIEELEFSIVALEKSLDELELDRQESEANLAEAYNWVREAMNEQLHAEVITRTAEDALQKLPQETVLRETVRVKEAALAKATAAYAAAESAYQSADIAENIGTSGTTTYSGISEAELERATARALDDVQYDENRLVEASNKVAARLDQKSGVEIEPKEEVSAVAAARTQRASVALDAAEIALDRAEAELDAAEAHLQEWQDAKEELTEADGAEKEARADYAEARVNLSGASEEWNSVLADITDTNTELKDLRKDLLETQALLSPLQDYKSAEGQMRYFSWQDDSGNKGSQFHMPFSYYEQEGDLIYGIQGGYAVSNNREFNDGREAGLTDTTLSIAKKNVNEINTVTYGLDINVPTGKSKMAANAIVPDDLADIGRFGEGWGVTPRFRVDHKIGEEDTWSYEASVSLKGPYDLEESPLNTSAHPGTEIRDLWEWMHAGQEWQMLANLSYSWYGKTSEGTNLYRQGGYTDAAIYYNRVLTPKQDLMGYYRYTVGRPSNYYSFVDWADLDGTLRTRYYGVEWKYQLSPKQSLRVMGNAMLASGRSYHPLTYQQIDGRRRYGLLLGYDRAIDEQNRYSVELERFYMKDGSAGSYHGWNIFLTYQRSF